MTAPLPQRRPPRVFIGSSAEGLAVAEAIHRALEHGYEATLWSHNVFEPGGYTLQSLIEQTKTREFAIFVVDADDMTTSRGEARNVTRDNVIFELGLFLGALGRECCFMVYDRDLGRKPDLPSDLMGVTPATYTRHSDNDLDASLGAATSKIKLQINRIHGSRKAEAVDGESRPFDRASGADALEALKTELKSICTSAAAQGWKVRESETTIRLWNRHGTKFSFSIGEPSHTRDRLRRFANELRAGGLRVNRRVRVPISYAPR